MDGGINFYLPGNEYETKNEDKENYIDTNKNKYDFDSNYMYQMSKKLEKKRPKPINRIQIPENINFINYSDLTTKNENNREKNIFLNNYKDNCPQAPKDLDDINLPWRGYSTPCQRKSKVNAVQNPLDLKDSAQKNDKNFMLAKKRENNPKNTKNVKNIIYHKYINELSKSITDITLFLIKKTVNYKDNKIDFKKLKNITYAQLKYDDTNLDFIGKIVKDILSYKDENIKNSIDNIIENSDYSPLEEFLNENIKDLILCFSPDKKHDYTKIYKIKLNRRYQALVKNLKNKGKSQEYIEYFEKCIKELINTYQKEK